MLLNIKLANGTSPFTAELAAINLMNIQNRQIMLCADTLRLQYMSNIYQTHPFITKIYTLQKQNNTIHCEYQELKTFILTLTEKRKPSPPKRKLSTNRWQYMIQIPIHGHIPNDWSVLGQTLLTINLEKSKAL